jgi:hypothetical protein
MNPSNPAWDNPPGKDSDATRPALPGTQKKSSPSESSPGTLEGSTANRMTGIRVQATLPRRTPRNIIRRYPMRISTNATRRFPT